VPIHFEDPLPSSKIIDFFKTFLPKHKTEILSAMEEKDFSRDRRFTLPIMLALLINMVRPGKRTGYQAVINRFFHDAQIDSGRSDSVAPPDKAAFHRARKKLPLDVLHGLYAKAATMAMELAGRFESLKWRGFRVLGVDGTKKNMPASEELAAFYGIPSGGVRPQMLCLTLYDVLAKVPLDGVAAPHATSERALAAILYERLGPGDLLLLDRGFPGFRLFDEIKSFGVDFLARLPANGLFGAVQTFLANGGRDGLVTIRPSASVVAQYALEGLPSPEPITLRIVKVFLPNGNSAVYATTLIDSAVYPPDQLKELYHLRWEEEEHFKLIKGLLEAENFRGKNPLFIAQELLAVNLYCLLTRILVLQSALEYGIEPKNIAQKPAFEAAARVLDRIWLSATRRQCINWIRFCIREISLSRYKKRPNRSYPRKFKR